MLPRPSEPAPVLFGERRHLAIHFVGQLEARLGHYIPRADGRTDGIFAEWSADAAAVTARTDRYGLAPLFYYHADDGSRFGVSPSVAALIDAGAPTALDYPALAVYLRLGQFVGDDTAFAAIRSAPPDSTLSWSGDTLEFRKAVYRPTPNTSITRAQAISAYIDLFRAALRRRPPRGEFAVPLSGGRDSRHILFELVSSGLRPKVCVTARTSYQDDIRVAGLVTKALQLEHAIVEPLGSPLQLELRKNEITSFGVDIGTWPLVIRDFLESNEIATVYDGIGGDVLSAGLFLTRELDQLFRRRRSSEIAAALLPDNEVILRKLVSAELCRHCPRDLAVDRLAKEIERHLDAHNPVTSFFFWNRTRRKIALTPYAMLGHQFTVFAPYLDADVFDFLTSLPTGLIIDHTFHSDTIRCAYPEWAEVPFERKDVPESHSPTQNLRFAREVARRLGMSLRRRFVREPSLTLRLLCCRLSANYAASSEWFLRPAVWLVQLEELLSAADIGCALLPPHAGTLGHTGTSVLLDHPQPQHPDR